MAAHIALPPLQTQRLRLRSWHDRDLAPFAAMNADAEVMRFFPATLSSAESEAMVARIAAHVLAHGFGWWVVCASTDDDDDAFVGCVGLTRPAYETPFTPAVEVGWRLARRFWGQGYAPEAARAAVAWGFDEHGLREIVSFTAVDNMSSRRVMEKIGMQRDLAGDFDHPRLPDGHPLQRHVLYRLSSSSASSSASSAARSSAASSARSS